MNTFHEDNYRRALPRSPVAWLSSGTTQQPQPPVARMRVLPPASIAVLNDWFANLVGVEHTRLLVSSASGHGRLAAGAKLLNGIGICRVQWACPNRLGRRVPPTT